MLKSLSSSWQLSTPTVTGRQHMYLKVPTVGRKCHRLTPKSIRLLTTGAIGMMATYYIQSLKLCYIARHH